MEGDHGKLLGQTDRTMLLNSLGTAAETDGTHHLMTSGYVTIHLHHKGTAVALTKSCLHLAVILVKDFHLGHGKATLAGRPQMAQNRIGPDTLTVGHPIGCTVLVPIEKSLEIGYSVIGSIMKEVDS